MTSSFGASSRNPVVGDYIDADALIVGSSIKQGGVWSGPIDESRATELARAFYKSQR
jgi:predicted TIM-barrel enzyme